MIALNFGPVLGNFWLWSGNFSLCMNIISFIYKMTQKISGLLNISGVCLEISSICPEIWIVHKDCDIFKASALWANAFCKSKCPSVCPCVGLFTFEVPFKRLFALTSRSRMSNIFRDSESLEKSNGKKWSQI